MTGDYHHLPKQQDNKNAISKKEVLTKNRTTPHSMSFPLEGETLEHDDHDEVDLNVTSKSLPTTSIAISQQRSEEQQSLSSDDDDEEEEEMKQLTMKHVSTVSRSSAAVTTKVGYGTSTWEESNTGKKKLSSGPSSSSFHDEFGSKIKRIARRRYQDDDYDGHNVKLPSNSSPLSSNDRSKRKRKRFCNTISKKQETKLLQGQKGKAVQTFASSNSSPVVFEVDGGKPAILSLSCDAMAKCLSYLSPIETYNVLTMPISRGWYGTYTEPQDLWCVLSLSDPFNATYDDKNSNGRRIKKNKRGSDNDDDDDSDDSSHCSSTSDESLCSFPSIIYCTTSDGPGELHQQASRHRFGRYRLLYTSFIRCMKYLNEMQNNVIHGRASSSTTMLDYGNIHNWIGPQLFKSNVSLRNYLANARVAATKRKPYRPDGGVSVAKANLKDDCCGISNGKEEALASLPPKNDDSSTKPIEVSDKDTVSIREEEKQGPEEGKVRYGPSSLTARLLGPTQNGQASNVNLPPSCAIYSIINWMVAFSDVEGIQTMCLRVLPYLLEDETNRTTAQRAGLTGTVIKSMVQFPDSLLLHTAAFHTIVLLTRPLGARETLLFSGWASAPSSSHDNGSSNNLLFNNGYSQDGKNGIAVMVDSMRRFEKEEKLQAMACWSFVNIALATKQKEVLLKLGGIEATMNAMVQHPFSAEVQFRALFSLINLVAPCAGVGDAHRAATVQQDPRGEEGGVGVEEKSLDENVENITNLVVAAMKNFCSSQLILNRASLVLFNLSLAPKYHETLLMTPSCYQMLEWCIANYPTDEVLQESAQGAVHRLETTLSNDEDLRHSFTAALHAQQIRSLEQAHREAMLLHDQHERHYRNMSSG